MTMHPSFALATYEQLVLVTRVDVSLGETCVHPWGWEV